MIKLLINFKFGVENLKRILRMARRVPARNEHHDQRRVAERDLSLCSFMI